MGLRVRLRAGIAFRTRIPNSGVAHRLWVVSLSSSVMEKWILISNGLATLIRTARIDLGVEVDINLDKIRLKKIHDKDKKPNISTEHWAMGTITYPNNEKVEGRRSEVRRSSREGYFFFPQRASQISANLVTTSGCFAARSIVSVRFLARL